MAWMMEHAKIKFTPFRWEFAHTRNGGNFTFYRATACDRAEAERRRGCMASVGATARDRVSFAHEVAWLVVFRRRCAILGVPRQIHGAPRPMQRFSLFFSLSVVYFARFTPLISLISSNNAPKATLSSILMLQRCFWSNLFSFLCNSFLLLHQFRLHKTSCQHYFHLFYPVTSRSPVMATCF